MDPLLTQLLDAFNSPDHPAGDDGISALRAMLADADTATLASTREAALERFEALYDAEATPSQDDLATMEALSQIMDAVGAEADARTAAEQEARDRAAALAARVRPTDPDQGEGEGGEEDDEDEQPPAAPQAGAPAPVPAPVTAGAGRPPARRTDLGGLAHTPPDTAGDSTIRMELIAAADVPGYATGAPLSNMRDLTTAIENRFAAMPKGVPGVRSEVGIAVIRRNIPEPLRFQTYGDRRDTAIIDACCDEHRLPGGSLVASALTAAGTPGWCAPAITDFTLCPPLSTLTGMVDLPTFTNQRGGIRIPSFPDYQTIAEAITGQILCGPDFTGKQCITAPCVDWVEFNPCAVPLCVIGDILQERGWPELVDRFVREVMTAQAHMANAYVIQQLISMVDDTIPATDVVNAQGALHQVVDELSLLVEWFRDLYQMGEDASLEVIGPSWLPGLLAADGRKRPNGPTNWTRAAINQQLADVGAAAQWVRDWQPLAVGTGTPPNVTFEPPTAWPTEVQFLLYPAGTFAKGQADIITLNGVYDSTLLADNQYTSLFTEESINVIKRCHRALLVTIPLCVSGAMGPGVDLCAATP